MEETELGNKNENEQDFFCDACNDFPFFDCRDSSIDVPSCSSVTALNSDPCQGNSSRANLRCRRRAYPDLSEESDHAKSSLTSGNGYVNFEVEKQDFLPGIKDVRDDIQRIPQNFKSPVESKHCENGIPDEGCVIKPKIVQVVDDPEYDVKSSAINDTTVNQNDDDAEHKACLEEKPAGEVDFQAEKNHSVVDAKFRGNIDNVEDNTQIAGNLDENTSFLSMLASFVIKAILFKLRITVYAFLWPVWLIYSTYKILTDPFHAVQQCKKYLIRRVLGLCGYSSGHISNSLSEFLEERTSFLKLGLKLGWGLLWAAYVCVVLVCLLVVAFVVGGILMKVLVEEPIRMREKLNFDYTEPSPVAYVPVAPGSKCGFCSTGKPSDYKLGVPPKHKLQVTVSLTLPESDYNKNLGIFQVRVDFLGPDGELLSSLRRPCMLRFNSVPIRLVLTLFKMAPFLTGYFTESQDVSVKLNGVTGRGDLPIACLRVMIEERAQLQRGGAGIPEIYSASVSLESIQPFFKRMIWFWKRSLFVWISLTIFMVELLFALICCTAIILPRVKLGLVNSAGNGTR